MQVVWELQEEFSNGTVQIPFNCRSTFFPQNICGILFDVFGVRRCFMGKSFAERKFNEEKMCFEGLMERFYVLKGSCTDLILSIFGDEFKL